MCFRTAFHNSPAEFCQFIGECFGIFYYLRDVLFEIGPGRLPQSYGNRRDSVEMWTALKPGNNNFVYFFVKLTLILFRKYHSRAWTTTRLVRCRRNNIRIRKRRRVHLARNEACEM